MSSEMDPYPINRVKLDYHRVNLQLLPIGTTSWSLEGMFRTVLFFLVNWCIRNH